MPGSFAIGAGPIAQTPPATPGAQPWRADEADSALSPGLRRLIAVGQASESDSAAAPTHVTLLPIGSANETDSADSAIAPRWVATALSARHAALLEGLARLHGLIDPLIVDPLASRGDGTIAQTVVTANGTTTLTTTAGPSGAQGASALTQEQAGWLEALARVHGLVDPLVVTATTRGDGTLLQTLSEVGGVTTVIRLQ